MDPQDVPSCWIETLCNMALNSIPKAFNPYDPDTWPEKADKDKLYIIYREGPIPSISPFWYGGDGAPELQKGYAKIIWVDLKVTHFLPIPEIAT